MAAMHGALTVQPALLDEAMAMIVWMTVSVAGR